MALFKNKSYIQSIGKGHGGAASQQTQRDTTQCSPATNARRNRGALKFAGFEEADDFADGDQGSPCLEYAAESTKWVEKNGPTTSERRKSENLVSDYECSSCNLVFISFCDLWTHHINCYNSLVYQLENNRNSFPGYDDWERRREQYKFACTFCDGGVETLEELNKHLKTHIEEAPFRCKVCSCKFHTIEDANEHLLDRHRIDPWSEQRHSYVGAMARLRQHSENEHSVVEELIAKKKMKQEDGYLEDASNGVRFIEQPGGFPCSKCDETFMEEKHALVHMPCTVPVIINGQESWHCVFDICGKGFASRFLLQQHMAIHLEKRWQCELCGHLFGNASQARQHYRVHSVKCYECPHCVVPFVSKHALKAHIEENHANKVV